MMCISTKMAPSAPSIVALVGVADNLLTGRLVGGERRRRQAARCGDGDSGRPFLLFDVLLDADSGAPPQLETK